MVLRRHCSASRAQVPLMHGTVPPPVQELFATQCAIRPEASGSLAAQLGFRIVFFHITYLVRLALSSGGRVHRHAQLRLTQKAPDVSQHLQQGRHARC